jgi:hypothetical protein
LAAKTFAILATAVISFATVRGEEKGIDLYSQVYENMPEFLLCYNVVAGESFKYRIEHLHGGGRQVFRKYLETENGEYLSEILKLDKKSVQHLHSGVLTVSGDPRKVPEIRTFYNHSPIYHLPLIINKFSVIGMDEIGPIIRTYKSPDHALNKISEISFKAGVPIPSQFSILPRGETMAQVSVFDGPKLLTDGFLIPSTLTVKIKEIVVFETVVDFAKSQVFESPIKEEEFKIPKALVDSIRNLEIGIETSVEGGVK